MLSVARGRLIVLALLVIVAAFTSVAAQGPPRGRGMMGHGMDADHQADMKLFHALLDNRERITRKVTVLDDGIDTLTESDDPEVTRLIQAHVASMLVRVKEARPIHQRDPLFREIFKHTDKIVVKHERTAKGVRVIETSADPYVAKLIQVHAEVVDAFIKNGHSEMMKDHPVPPPK